MIKNTAILVPRSLALLLSTILATQALVAQGAELRADPDAGQQPGILATASGARLVDIVEPDASGLSHNKYSDFNVDRHGLILNNSIGKSAFSELGGLVSPNMNLQPHFPAKVILNEVTGTGRSLLEGMIEVHGAGANVIIANPNGLTCDGCGFINTPRVTLSTGTPEFGESGELKALTVKGGDINIGPMGARLDSANVFDIVSRKISINGLVSGGGDINLIAGANRFYYGSGEVEALPSDGQEPEVAIDVSALGGMYAGRIKVVSNDMGSGVNMQGHMAANAGALSITADGKLTLRSADAKGDLSLRSKKSAVRLDDTIFSDKAVVLEGLTSVELAEKAVLYAAGDVKLGAKSVELAPWATAGGGSSREGIMSMTGALAVAADTLKVSSARLAGGKLLSIVASDVHLASAKPDDWPTLVTHGNLEIKANTVNAETALSVAGGNIAIMSEKTLQLHLGQYHSSGLISVIAEDMTTSAGLESTSGTSLKTTKGGLHNKGKISSEANIDVASAEAFTNDGHVLATMTIELNGATEVANNAEAVLSGTESVEVVAERISNRGLLESSQGGIKLRSQGTIINTSEMQAKTKVDLERSATFENSGTVLAGSIVTADVTGGDIINSGKVNARIIDLKSKNLKNDDHFVASQLLIANVENLNNSRVIAANDVLLVLGGRLLNADRIYGSNKIAIVGEGSDFTGEIVNNTGGVIHGENELSIVTNSVLNAGSMGSANGAFEIRAAGQVKNKRGILYSKGMSRYQIGGDFLNEGGSAISEQGIAITGLHGPRVTHFLNDQGIIEVIGGNLEIDAEKVTNHHFLYMTKPEVITETGSNITTVTTTEIGTAWGRRPKISADGDLTINTETLLNSFGQIAASGVVSIQAGSVTNEGRDLLKTIDTNPVKQHSLKYCGSRIFGACLSTETKTWMETDHDKKVSTYRTIHGTIQAGTQLYVNASGYVQNNSVRGNAGELDLISGGTVPAEVALPKIVEAIASDVSIQSVLGRPAIFRPVESPDAPIVIETHSKFIDVSKFRDGVIRDKPDERLKRVGDAYVEFTLIRDQYFELTGERLTGIPSEYNKISDIYHKNATQVKQELGLVYRRPLTDEQISKLTSNIIWVEEKEVLGRSTLFPRLYIAPVHYKASNITGAQIKAGEVEITADQITNSGAVRSDAGLALTSNTNIENRGGLVAHGSVALDAKQAVLNLSGSVKGDDVFITADNVVNSTQVTRDYMAPGWVDRTHQAAELIAKHNLDVTAGASVVSEAGVFEAGRHVTVKAGTSAELKTVEVTRIRNDKFDGGQDYGIQITNEFSEVKAGNRVTMTTGADLTLAGAKITAANGVTLEAGTRVDMQIVEDEESRDVEINIETGGFFGTKTNYNEQVSNTKEHAARIETGGDTAITAKKGDVTLEATIIKSSGETVITAEEGKVTRTIPSDETSPADHVTNIMSSIDLVMAEDVTKHTNWKGYESFIQEFHSKLKNKAIDTLGSDITMKIDTAVSSHDVVKLAKLISHVALSCSTGGVVQGCAVGAEAGNAITAMMLEGWVRNKLVELTSERVWTIEEMVDHRKRFDTQFENFKRRGVDIAALSGGLIYVLLNDHRKRGSKAAEENATDEVITR